MTTLVFGKTGQVAAALSGFDGVTCLGRDVADLSDPASCAQAILDRQPSAVINAAAYTAVDKAEDEEDLATVINGAAPAAMAEAAKSLDIPFVTISTDYVFDGAGQAPFEPDQPCAPLGAYGRSKLAGEQQVAKIGGRFAVLRTSWVFSETGNNFVKTMLRLGAERDRLNIVSDQVGGPTPAGAIAKACLTIANGLAESPQDAGIYHFSGQEDVSWADFARAIFAQSGTQCEVHDIASSEYPTPATRPANSRLNCETTKAQFGIERPSWQAGLTDVLQKLGAST